MTAGQNLHNLHFNLTRFVFLSFRNKEMSLEEWPLRMFVCGCCPGSDRRLTLVFLYVPLKTFETVLQSCEKDTRPLPIYPL